MKTETLHCANTKCRKEIGRAGVASSANGKTNFFCGFVCKKAFNDAGGVVDDRQLRRPPRKQTQAEIRRALKRAAIPTENQISNSAAEVLEGRGVYHTRIQSGSLETKSGHYMKLARIGTPDRMFADGVICFLEIKKPDARPGDAQLETIADLRSNGALAFVVDDYGQTEFIVAALDRRRKRIDDIAAAIAELQTEIETEFNNLYGRKT